MGGSRGTGPPAAATNAMHITEIETKLRKIVCDQIGCRADEVTGAARFAEDLVCDRLDGIEIAMAVEEEFGVSVDDAEAEKCKTFADAVALVKRLLDAQ